MNHLNWADFLTIAFFLGLLFYLVGKNFSLKETKEEYFMAGKNLSWPVIGFAFFVTNISTEQFIGMAGAGFRKGLVMACYEWLGILVIIVVAIFILPKYLRAGINTLPEYLEYRYNGSVRLVVSVAMFFAYVFITISGMLYANVVAIETILNYHSTNTYWFLAMIAGTLAIVGGLKTVMKLEVVFALIMILGGLMVSVFSIIKVGGFSEIMAQAPQKVHTLLPSNDPDLPWNSIILGGFWFGAFFYFGFNQYMMQKLFTTPSLSTAQKGILLAASLKLIIPFIIVLPAIIAFILYSNQITDPDASYPLLALQVLPEGFKGTFYCMLFAAVFGSFISVLNSASTIFSLDIYKRFIKPEIADEMLVRVGRISIVVMLIAACLWAPHIKDFGGVFIYIKKYFGFIYPSVIVVFLAGWTSKKVSPTAALSTILANPIVFSFMLYYFPSKAYLTSIAYTTIILAILISIITILAPWKSKFSIPDRVNIRFERNLGIFIWCIFLFTSSVALIVLFI
jgi:solute:Na+ symporter, SSS family